MSEWIRGSWGFKCISSHLRTLLIIDCRIRRDGLRKFEIDIACRSLWEGISGVNRRMYLALIDTWLADFKLDDRQVGWCRLKYFTPATLLPSYHHPHSKMAKYQRPIWGIGNDLGQLNFIYRELHVDSKDIPYLTENVRILPLLPLLPPPSFLC